MPAPAEFPTDSSEGPAQNTFNDEFAATAEFFSAGYPTVEATQYPLNDTDALMECYNG